MFEGIKRFLSERAKWKKAGSPIRNVHAIRELFIICSKCPHFVRSKKNMHEGNCGICSCRLSREKEYLNKLAWATTRCPLDPPKWLELPQYAELAEPSDEEIKVEEQLAEEEKKKEQENPAPPEKKKGCGCGG